MQTTLRVTTEDGQRRDIWICSRPECPGCYVLEDDLLLEVGLPCPQRNRLIYRLGGQYFLIAGRRPNFEQWLLCPVTLVGLGAFLWYRFLEPRYWCVMHFLWQLGILKTPEGHRISWRHFVLWDWFIRRRFHRDAGRDFGGRGLV